MASTPKNETIDEMMSRNAAVKGSTTDRTIASKDGPRVPKIDEYMRGRSADQPRDTGGRRR
jgi:hypothetical protein